MPQPDHASMTWQMIEDIEKRIDELDPDLTLSTNADLIRARADLALTRGVLALVDELRAHRGAEPQFS